MASVSAPALQLVSRRQTAFEPALEPVFERLRKLMMRVAPVEGYTGVHAPDICFYRFSQPTPLRKSATFGVTLGVVLQGTKRWRLGQHEIEVNPMRALVVTRDTENEIAASMAAGQQFIGIGLCFPPERVARAL